MTSSSSAASALRDIAPQQPTQNTANGDANPDVRQAEPGAPRAAQAALHAANAAHPEPHQFDRVGKAMLLVTTTMLETPEIVPLAVTSTTLHAALAPEIASRRQVDKIVAGVKTQVEFEGIEIRITAGQLATSGVNKLSANEWRYHSWSALKHGRTEDAERAARAAIAGDPELSFNHEQLAAVLLQAGRLEEAIVEARAALALADWRDSAALILAQAHLLLGDLDSAQRYLRASTADPFRIALTRAMIEHSLGHTAESETAMAMAIELTDNISNPQSLVAEAYAWLGDASNALLWMERAAEQPWDREITRVALSPFAANIYRDLHWQLVRTGAQQLVAQSMPGLPPLFARSEPLKA